MKQQYLRVMPLSTPDIQVIAAADAMNKVAIDLGICKVMFHNKESEYYRNWEISAFQTDNLHGKPAKGIEILGWDKVSQVEAKLISKKHQQAAIDSYNKKVDEETAKNTHPVAEEEA